MTRRTRRAACLFGAAALLTLAWPGPSSADTTLGGYSGTAQAQAVRVQIYDPVIPIPATPQVDGGIGFTRTSTDTGPVSRALASYLWPGDVVGDGFSQLVGNPSAKYPVQVNSRYPATSDAPARNTAQLTDGNGMTTSSDDTTTRATVTGLGIAGPDTDLLSGIGKGLGQLAGNNTPTKDLPPAPVPVGKTLAGLVTAQGVQSQSSVVVGAKTITSTAHTFVSQLRLLGGLVSLGNTDVTSTTVSDGTRATTTGAVKAGYLSVAGQEIALDGTTLKGAGTGVQLPPLPGTVTSVLAKIGIELTVAPSTRTVDGATGSLASSGLVISLDTVPLKTALNLGGIIAPLQELISKIPNLGSQVGPLLSLGPKIVISVGDVSSSATAAPAYTGGGLPAGGGSTPATGGGGTGGSTSTGSGGAGVGGGSIGGTGGGTLPGTGTGGTAAQTGSGTGGALQPIQQASYGLPGLGAVPRMLVLGSLLLAAALGWVLRTAGGFLLGGARNCSYGLSTGVPDLRKG